MSDVPVHLAFPDRVLRYDCDACDQRCCKTSGLAVFPAEREALIRRHPALELVEPAAPGAITVFATPPSGCWFLDGPRCSLVARSGDVHANRRHDPGRPRACTLFPFNLFGTVGDALVVAPNGLCPLWVEPGAGVGHAEVLELLAQLGAAGAPPPVLRADGDASLPLERVVRDAATASLTEPSPLPLIAFTELATAATLEHGDPERAMVGQGAIGETIEALEATLTVLAGVVGVPVPADADLADVAPTLAAWTPTLRLFAFEHVPIGSLPRALLALTLYAAHWQALRPERRLLPQTLMQMIGSLGPTLELLAAWDQPWRGGPVDGLPLRDGELPSVALAEALAPMPEDSAATFDRTALLRRLADAHRAGVIGAAS
jgi:hypothetical protein